MERRPRLLPPAVLVLAFLHAGLAISASVDRSATADETDYLAAGRWILETRDWDFSSAGFHPPLAYYLNSLLLWDAPDSLWSARPAGGARFVAYDRQVGEVLLHRSGLDPTGVLFRARLPIALASALLVVLVYAWAREALGPRAAALAAILAAFCPNLLAHAGVVATDSVLATTYFGGAYASWRFLRRPTFGRLAVAGLAIGLAALAKVPGVLLAPAFGLLVLSRLAADGSFARAFRFPGSAWTSRGRLRRTIAGVAVAGLVAGAIALSVVWAGYLFQTGRVLDPDHRPHRALDRRVPETLGLRRIIYAVLESPLPAPGYLGVVRTLMGHSEHGHHAYLLGERNLRGWWYYFPVAIAVKTPLPALLLAGAGAILLARRRDVPGRAEIAIFALFAFVPSIASPIAIGVRHVLHVYPFAFLAAGAVVEGGGRKRRVLAALGAAWLVLGTAADYPHFLASFNAAAGGPRGGHRILSDSNVDWGQDLDRLAGFHEHAGEPSMAADLFFHVPDAVEERFATTGDPVLFALGVTARHGQYDRENPDRYEAYDPEEAVVRVGYGIEVYERR